jgi:hypothetical protein
MAQVSDKRTVLNQKQWRLLRLFLTHPVRN